MPLVRFDPHPEIDDVPMTDVVVDTGVVQHLITARCINEPGGTDESLVGLFAKLDRGGDR